MPLPRAGHPTARAVESVKASAPLKTAGEDLVWWWGWWWWWWWCAAHNSELPQAGLPRIWGSISILPQGTSNLSTLRKARRPRMSTSESYVRPSDRVQSISPLVGVWTQWGDAVHPGGATQGARGGGTPLTGARGACVTLLGGGSLLSQSGGGGSMP